MKGDKKMSVEALQCKECGQRYELEGFERPFPAVEGNGHGSEEVVTQPGDSATRR